MRLVALVTAAAAALGSAGCGAGDDAPADVPQDPVAAACMGTTTGANALRPAEGRTVEQRIEHGMRVATAAAHALEDLRDGSGQRQERAVRALEVQAARLRAVRDQLERGPSPAAILRAARASLEDGDRQAVRRLAEAGIDCPPP